MSLPEPTNLDINPRTFKLNDLYHEQPKKPASKNKIDKPTPEQIKWDIEDQSFIKKEFKPMNQSEEKIIDQVDDEEDFIDEKGKKQILKKIDISQIKNDNWRE